MNKLLIYWGRRRALGSQGTVWMNRLSSTMPEVPGLPPSGSKSPHGQSRSGVAATEGDQRPELIPSFH